MNDLERYAAGGGSSLVLSKDQRERKKQIAKLVADTKFAGLQVDAEAALTGRIMERTVDIDNYRRALAGNDETLNALLTRIELGFLAKAERRQRQFGSEFPL